MKPFLPALVLLLFTACNNNDVKEESSVADSTKITKDASFFEDADITWISQHAQRYIREDNIKLTEEGKQNFDSRNFVPSRDFFSNYSTVLRWSPDSSKVLDIGSYGSVIATDKYGKTSIQQGEPDSEVAYIDLEQRTRYRLFYAGPSAKVIEGKWMDDNTVMFITTFEDMDATETTVSIISLRDGMVRKYSLQ